jgi:LysR family transcriptional regulator, low CO2-responsive transcriptional regulator
VKTLQLEGRSPHCGTGEVVAFVSAQHPLAEKKALSISDVRNTPLVVRTRTGKNPTRSWQRLQALANEGAPLSIAMDCDSLRTLRHAVKSGKGLGFCYREYLAGEIKRDEIKVIKVEGFEHRYDNFVVYAKDRPLSEAAEKFLALIRRRIGKAMRAAQPIKQSV